MKFIDYIENMKKIPDYHVESHLEDFMIDYRKPSSRIIQTDIGLKTIALLKQIEEKNNHSWYAELRERSKGYENNLALFYRGNKITYSEMFAKADLLAKAMVEVGIEAGDEIPCCLANTPELVYVMLAANKINAKLNLFGSGLNENYLKSIINDTCHKVLFISDDNYMKLKDLISDIHFDNKVVISLADSLPDHPELCDEYEPDFAEYYHYDNITEMLKKNGENISSFSDFIKLGLKSQKEIIDNGDLNTEFTITYTSGSTRIGFPKQIIHSNRSYIIGGIYNATNLTGSPEVPEIRGLAHIHSDSNTNLVTCISDNLMKHGSVALEPEYDKDKALDYIIINKPVHLDATTSFLVNVAKKYYFDEKYKKNGKRIKLPYQLVTMAVGEKTSKGEEKFINSFLKKASAGSKIKLNGINLPYGPLSIGGGDCEHGGIYYTLLKKLQQAAKFSKLGTREYGMTPVPFAIVTALKPTGDGKFDECDYGEYGIIVANSITSMSGYKNEVCKTESKIVRDIYGRDWLSCDVYGYINEIGNVVVKGRKEDTLKLADGTEFPEFMIDDVVCQDTKNIMSCSTTRVSTENGDIPILNIEFSPLKHKSNISVLTSLENRCKKYLPESVCENILIRVIDSQESYPLTGSGKRDIHALQNMGLENTFSMKNGKIVNTPSNIIAYNKEKTKVLS